MMDESFGGSSNGGRKGHVARRRTTKELQIKEHCNRYERSTLRSSLFLSSLSTKALAYGCLFICAQGLLAYNLYYSYKETTLGEKTDRSRSKNVQYPDNYQPPCRINAKEALSALKRVTSSECKRDLAEVACKSENDLLYPKTLPNLCPGVKDDIPPNSGKYLGCYRDSLDARILQGSFSRLQNNSRVQCINLCFSSGYLLAGTQYGKECFCGNVLPSEDLQTDESNCNRPCSGDPDTNCGGFLTMSIYETGFKIKDEHQIQDNYGEPVRIVYLLTVNGRATRQLKRLIKLLFNHRNYFYIHVDSRQDYMYREMKELSDQFPEFIKLSPRRFSTIWGGASLLQMLVSCMTELLNMNDWNWDFVINLSESDYPVKNPQKLVDFLSENRDKNFVKSHGRDPQVFISKQGLDQTFYECDTHMFRLGSRQLPDGILVDGGSDWVCLNKKFVEYVVFGNDTMINGLRVVFNFTLLPAESFFHTTLKNSKFCSSYVNNNLRMTNWKRHLGCKCQHKAIVDWCGCSPNDFLLEDIHKLQLSKKKDIFFARKFEPIVSQGVLDYVDAELLESSLITDKNYWQNIFHYLDNSPKQDPAMATIGQTLAESAINVLGFQLEDLQQITSFFYDDNFQGVVVTFSGQDEDPESGDSGGLVFEAFVRVKMFQSKIEYRNGLISVGTEFDPKELIFRNTLSAIGPLSKPVLTYEFEDATLEQNVSAQVVWRDPVGRTVSISNVVLPNNTSVKESVELKNENPLMPGMWSVTFSIQQHTSSRHSISSKVPFLVTPLLPVTSELESSQYLKRLHQPGQAQFLNKEEDADLIDVDRLENEELILAQAKRNAEKEGVELKSWVGDLASSFYTIEAICGVTFPKDFPSPKFKLLPKCSESEWSTHYPDEKSKVSNFEASTIDSS